MSDQANLVSSVEPPLDLGGASPTAGGLLKAARQAAGLHLAILSVSLKVPVRQLEALEANVFPNDPSLVFSRALAASVCRHLRIDPGPILALIPVPDSPLPVGPGLRQPYTPGGQGGHLRRTRFTLTNRSGWLALAMTALIVVLIWGPGTFLWQSGWSQPAKSPEVSGGSVGLVTDAVALGESTPSGITVPGTLLNPAATVLPTVVLPASPPVSGTVTPPPELLFIAQSTSWIEVREANQRVLWTGVLNAGDTQRLNAARALSVVVGRADAIQVSFKGQPLDLAPYTQVNVARFEVKP